MIIEITSYDIADEKNHKKIDVYLLKLDESFSNIYADTSERMFKITNIYQSVKIS